MSNLIGVAQVAERMGISVKTVYRYAQDGKLPRVKLCPGQHGAVRFDPKEIERYINKHRQEAV